MARVLITGGAGFIGSAVIRHILDGQSFDGTVLNLDKLTYAANLKALDSVVSDSRYRFEKIDIVDWPATRQIFQDFRPEVVIHLAAETHVDRSIDDPFEFIRTNVQGTCNLLHAALETSAGMQNFRFVHVSTDEVFGSMDVGRSALEEDAYRPNSPYSASKAASDHFARAWHVTYGLPVIVTNCTNNYGPWQYPEKLIPVIVLNALSGRPLPIYGDGSNVRDWLFVEDHARAIWLAAQQGETGSNYNISGDAERSNVEVVNQVCTVLDELRPRSDGQSYTNQIKFVPDRPGHDRRYSLNSDRIENSLGWRPGVSFEEGFRRTVEWYVENAGELERNTQSASAERRGLRE
ncbi:MAG: dTDP-glucose 4,6-dehydratase [Gammaproteobacteria bacterium]|nr:dTDP-glucose 4,6-dehydratase [Gammaproteobacteria bacterium]